ncbi:hypothetical protein BRPE64_ACDS04900 [Caballeronia insecticola]|uniref:Uncharacterized protein n=1 Tax=Caballeronia insecticola TaxID=758793 RepID=R4WFI9_9BURK|nr:hypothetical protein BRPE64_ACDS04900 [Caballeronia insecticola]
MCPAVIALRFFNPPPSVARMVEPVDSPRPGADAACRAHRRHALPDPFLPLARRAFFFFVARPSPPA